jgi:hypothetical protein
MKYALVITQNSIDVLYWHSGVSAVCLQERRHLLNKFYPVVAEAIYRRNLSQKIVIFITN